MPKQGEIEYLQKMGEEGVRHAMGKPFSDAHCPFYLMEMGAVMALLPAPPARLLDVGCGTGWTSVFFARRGHEVVGVDIAGDMIYHANELREREGLDNLSFQVSDYEEMGFDGEFDCAVFYDALHHAVDEVAALRGVYRALRPGGVCITSEPGVGHARHPVSVEAMRKYNVTERDMPPRTIVAAGRQVGFRRFQVYPHAAELGNSIYSYSGRLLRGLAAASPRARQWCGLAYALRILFYRARRSGIVVLVK